MKTQYRNVETGEFVKERDIGALVTGGAVIEIVEPTPENVPEFPNVDPYSDWETEWAVEV